MVPTALDLTREQAWETLTEYTKSEALRRHALAVEDSPNGIKAAKAAGLWCATVPHVLTETLDLSAADVRLDSLASSTIADVIARL